MADREEGARAYAGTAGWWVGGWAVTLQRSGGALPGQPHPATRSTAPGSPTQPLAQLLLAAEIEAGVLTATGHAEVKEAAPKESPGGTMAGNAP